MDTRSRDTKSSAMDNGESSQYGAHLPMEHDPLRHSRDGVLGLIQRGELRFDAFVGESHVGIGIMSQIDVVRRCRLDVNPTITTQSTTDPVLLSVAK